jgi:hypothetical protein
MLTRRQLFAGAAVTALALTRHDRGQAEDAAPAITVYKDPT